MDRPVRGVTFDVVDGGGREWTVLRLLALLAGSVIPLRWHATNLEMSPGPMADRAERLLRHEVDGPALLSAFALDPQIIEGSLKGDATPDGDARIRIDAVDGAHWDVYADDPDVLDAVRAAVDGCRSIPS